LAVLFVALLVDILWPRRQQLFWIAGGVVVLCYILTLNVMNLDAFIAHSNIERYDKTGKLDVYYLLTLSDDAVPVVADLLDEPDVPERDLLLERLGERLYTLDQDREGRNLFGYHWGKDRAWRALDAHRETLAPYYHAPTPLYPYNPYRSSY
jgi:hypothetical protein